MTKERGFADGWFPVAGSDDLPPRHVYAGQLAGHELAIWRADDGHLNVWEDRCVHRGVRLSIGHNDGAELVCAYHGWRYANRTGGCTYIPAHPADAPAQTICLRSFPLVERYGLVWSGIAPTGEPPTIAMLEGRSSTVLRSLPFDADPALVRERLKDHRFLPTAAVGHGIEPTMAYESLGELGIALTSTVGESSSTAVFFVQPVDADRSIVRPMLIGDLCSTGNAGAARGTGNTGDTGHLRNTGGTGNAGIGDPEPTAIGALLHHSHRLDDLRRRVEAEASTLAAPAKLTPAFEPAAAIAERARDARSSPVRVVVAAKREVATDVTEFELAPIDGDLPAFQPGAHLDVHLPNGLVRQYSLTNGPDVTDAYHIGVKRTADSAGGSACLHGDVREGDVLAISEPHNNFPLRRDAAGTILIAGGIGVTPLLSMAKALARNRLDWTMHYFVQGVDHVAFPDDLRRLGDPVVVHAGLDPAETRSELGRILGDRADHSHVYVCGPAPMLEAARSIAAKARWPDDAVHFEYFANHTEVLDTSEFDVDLARSAMTVRVRSGQTILEVLRANGVTVPSSCQQGACGTCLVGVLDGSPDHQDVYLNEAERAAGDRIATCVSRSLTDRITLDL